ncbi:hypothetical protein SAMN05444362_101331 [Dysgonomonas macrotermitis]|uniref:Uncharacterized protein n=1 Tax=Dysgonomonas macrotermitis TaxID=1346286 RepID=A0A1M4TI46_9BACT|nr:hypothetical protein SAMN05444362_101331 [Dysgonomonas macrotermitis]
MFFDILKLKELKGGKLEAKKINSRKVSPLSLSWR